MSRIRVAVASSDGIFINQHFGKATRFFVYDVGPDGVSLVEVRDNAEPLCGSDTERNHAPGAFDRIFDLLADCSVVLVSMIGFGASEQLKSRWITVYEVPGPIEKALYRLSNNRLTRRILGAAEGAPACDACGCAEEGKKG